MSRRTTGGGRGIGVATVGAGASPLIRGVRPTYPARAVPDDVPTVRNSARIIVWLPERRVIASLTPFRICRQTQPSTMRSKSLSFSRRSTPGWRSSTRARASRTKRSNGDSGCDAHHLVAASPPRPRIHPSLHRPRLAALCGACCASVGHGSRATGHVS